MNVENGIESVTTTIPVFYFSLLPNIYRNETRLFHKTYWFDCVILLLAHENQVVLNFYKFLIVQE